MGAEPPPPAQKATTLAGTTPQPTPGGGSHREKILNDTPAIRGMIAKVSHLVEVQEIEG